MNLPLFAIGLLRGHWKLIAALALFLIPVAGWWRSDSLRAGYKTERDAARQEYAAFRKEITDRATAALTKEKAQARAADKSHTKELADARSATDRYIAAHRMRPAGSCHSPAPAAPSAGLPQEVPTDPVMVGSSDVRACGDLYAYALAAHQWANAASQPSSP